MEKAVIIKNIGTFNIFKRLEKRPGEETYVVQDGNIAQDFNSLRKAERFAERSLGIRSDGSIIADAGFCMS